MDLQKIIKALDHTQLDPAATWDDIRKACDEAIQYQTASVCIPSSYVQQAAAYVQGRIPICTVIGFPHGNIDVSSKLFEAKDAVLNGASEIDMVINLSNVKSEQYERVFAEISSIKTMIDSCILKVIVECCLLDEDEKIQLCAICEQAGADYIKTSTGFSTGGATVEDVTLFHHLIHSAPAGSSFKVKAAGGIRTLESAWELMEAGASRLGASKLLPLIAQELQKA